MIVELFTSGVEGIPVSYSPRTDDTIALTLLVCFFLSSIALAKGKKFLSQQVKDFVLHRERTSIFDSSTAADVRYLLVLVLQTCVLSGITFFNYFHDTFPTLMDHVSSLLLMVTLIVLYYLMLQLQGQTPLLISVHLTFAFQLLKLLESKLLPFLQTF